MGQWNEKNNNAYVMRCRHIKDRRKKFKQIDSRTKRIKEMTLLLWRRDKEYKLSSEMSFDILGSKEGSLNQDSSIGAQVSECKPT